MHRTLPVGVGTARSPWGCGVQRYAFSTCTTLPQLRSANRTARKGSAARCSRSAVTCKLSPMLHPPGPSILYPDSNTKVKQMLEDLVELQERTAMEGIAAGLSSGMPAENVFRTEAVIESPPEWGAPDEGNPNQPRRVPEYQPPQEPVPGSPSTPEFDPPERTRPSPPVPEDDPMRPLPPEQPEIPPNERDPLKKAPKQMPDKQPARRGDEQTQPQPGETSASMAASEEEEGEDLTPEEAAERV